MICECAVWMYRDNFAGTRDYKLKGSLHCKKCRGHGRCVKCPNCSGAGIGTNSKVCDRCIGSGFVPGKRPPASACESHIPSSSSAEGATTYQPRAQP